MNATPTDWRRAYWRANLKLLAVLLIIWFAVSFGAGILFVDALDQIRIGGFKLGFWFSQQGSIYTFVVLIAVYVWRMNALDRELAKVRPPAGTASVVPDAPADKEPS